MLYLDRKNIIPGINPNCGDKIRFVNQVTKEVTEYDLTFEDGIYVLSQIPDLVGDFDYFILSGEDVLQSGVASSLGSRKATHYQSDINIKSYNG